LQIDSPDYVLFIQRIEAEQAYLSLKQGSTHYAWEWLLRCGISHTDEVTFNRIPEHLVYARVLAEFDRMEDAWFLLERMYTLLSKADRLRDTVKVLILQSMILQRMGKTDVALARLEFAINLAEPEGYIRSFIDEGPVMVKMLSTYTLSDSLPYVRKLLLAMNITLEEDQPPKELLTEQEMRILLLITDGLSNKQIADRLNITFETVKSHIKNVYRKLSVNNRVQALQRAKELRILV
jgi:LuxR family maltose regulon positive regulatory protein